ncbi:MAG: ABC transporter ATP-binding protein [Deltaproteobacteria bacterium]|nr:ABC transporter ATP-binding protein [Deltaproteobacteria bacterium]
MAFLELRGVGKSYWTPRGWYSVLDNLNLDVEAGEFVCIVGYSGSGKTTLVSLIAGLMQPDCGEIRLGGELVRGPGPDRGIVFQNYSLLAWMSVFENVYLAVDAVSPQLSAAQKRERTDHLIATVNLSAAAHKRPHELSGGMRQRVAVARGLAMNPQLLLLDEPFSALDALTRATLQTELARLWMEERKTVVMITNDVEEAILLADRIYPLTPGPAAHLGPEIVVDLPHPRSSRALNLQPGYHHARRDIVEFLASQRRATNRSAAPETPALAVAS